MAGRFSWLSQGDAPLGLRPAGWTAVAYAAVATLAFLVGLALRPEDTAATVIWGLLPGPWAEEIATEVTGPRLLLLFLLWLVALQLAGAFILWGGSVVAAWREGPAAAKTKLIAIGLILLMGGAVDVGLEVFGSITEGDYADVDPFGLLMVVFGIMVLVGASRGEARQERVQRSEPMEVEPGRIIRAGSRAASPSQAPAPRPRPPGERGPGQL